MFKILTGNVLYVRPARGPSDKTRIRAPPRHPDSVIQLVKVESEHVEKHSASSNGEDRNSLH